jgi:cytochrome c-type biogenesis protein CcmH
MSGDLIRACLPDRLYRRRAGCLPWPDWSWRSRPVEPATAAPLVNPVDFDTPEQEAQYQKLVRELRCTVCQSETIYESNAALAGDMRRRVYEMTAAGASEQEIIDFLVQRYGDYVRYRPAFQANTVLAVDQPLPDPGRGRTDLDAGCAAAPPARGPRRPDHAGA